MYRFSIVLSAIALVAAFAPGNSLAQCCGGDSKMHSGCGAAAKAPSKESPQQTVAADAEPAKAARLPADPVTGEPIDFAVKTVAADGPIYFANEAALKKFKEKPDAYAAKVNEQRAALARLPRVQVNCPIMGQPVDGQTFAYVDGQGVFFCCPMCQPKYVADPAKYQASLAAAFTYQTRCPIDGATIDPTVYVDLPTGARVYLCSKDEIENFTKDPAAYAANLAAQGVRSAAPKPDETKAEKTSRLPLRASAEQPAHAPGAPENSTMNHR